MQLLGCQFMFRCHSFLGVYYFDPERGQQLLDKAAEVGKILSGLVAAIRRAA